MADDKMWDAGKGNIFCCNLMKQFRTIFLSSVWPGLIAYNLFYLTTSQSMTNFCNEIPDTTTLGKSHYFPGCKTEPAAALLTNPNIISQLKPAFHSNEDIKACKWTKNQSLFWWMKEIEDTLIIFNLQIIFRSVESVRVFAQQVNLAKIGSF